MGRMGSFVLWQDSIFFRCRGGLKLHSLIVVRYYRIGLDRDLPCNPCIPAPSFDENCVHTYKGLEPLFFECIWNTAISLPVCSIYIR